MDRISSTASLVILISLIVFNSCEEKSIKEDTQADNDEDVDIFDIIVKHNKEDQRLKPGVHNDASTGKHLYEGDIMLDETPNQMLYEMGRKTEEGAFGVIIWPLRVWRTREVPYTINGHTPQAIQKIKAAMKELEKVVCVRFRPKASVDKYWLNIYNGRGCWSVIGRSHRLKTDVSLASYCVFSQALIIHELVHSLGFFHEQSRRDRDFHVKVLSNNINPSQLYNFKKADRHSVETFGTPYDYLSLMHYTRTTFTKNGQSTLESKADPNQKLGGFKLSSYDIKKLKSMYHCNFKASQGWTDWSDWSPCLTTYKGCYQSQYRMCFAKDLTLCPGSDESGVRYKTRQCASTQECTKEPFDGYWGNWAPWNSCSKPCGVGTRSRSRKCDSPKPVNGGKGCVGQSNDVEKCILKTCRKNKFFNNFNEGLGMWYNANKDRNPLKWRRGRGRLSSDANSGPQGDHTNGNGWYLYVSSKRVMDNRRKATLASEYLSGFKCFSFAYSMNGRTMGQLTFYVIGINGKLIGYSFNKKGHQGKDWNRFEMSLDNPDFKKYSYRIFIEATTGISPYTDIAIDDLLLENGRCQPNLMIKKPKTSALLVSSACKDKHSKCGFWAKTGECHTNPEFMKKDCCLSCKDKGECIKDTHDILKCNEWTGKGECMKNSDWMWINCCKTCQTVQGSCDSKHSQCEDWANQGYCNMKETEFWMHTNCCHPCHLAFEDSKKCLDRHIKCQQWALDGECKKNPDWMKYNCCKSCKQA